MTIKMIKNKMEQGSARGITKKELTAWPSHTPFTLASGLPKFVDK